MVIGGPNSKQEKYFNDSFASLDARILASEKKLTQILTKAYDSPKLGAKYWNKVRRDLNREYAELNVMYKSWAKVKVPRAYKVYMKDLFNRLNKSRQIAKKASKSYASLSTSPRTLQMTKALYNDAIREWTASLNAGKSNLNRLTRRTQQTLLKESIIDSSVAKAIESGNLLNNSFYNSTNMSNTLASQLKEVAEVIEGKYYVTAGKRRFKANYYAKLVSRVKFHEAQAYGAIQVATNYGTSLLQVSNHNTKTEVCQKYENKIYSVGGKDPNYDILLEVSPFHPNCLHNMFPVFADTLEALGQSEQWEDFSKGRIDTPPSPKNFVPISKRGQ